RNSTRTRAICSLATSAIAVAPRLAVRIEHLSVCNTLRQRLTTGPASSTTRIAGFRALGLGAGGAVGPDAAGAPFTGFAKKAVWPVLGAATGGAVDSASPVGTASGDDTSTPNAPRNACHSGLL